MTRDDIIRMAREAGIDVDTAWGVSDAAVERFASLVAAAERAGCAKVCERDDSVRWAGAADAIRNRGKQ